MKYLDKPGEKITAKGVEHVLDQVLDKKERKLVEVKSTGDGVEIRENYADVDGKTADMIRKKVGDSLKKGGVFWSRFWVRAWD